MAEDPTAVTDPPEDPVVPDPAPSSETITVPKSELDALRRRVGESEKAARRAAQDAKDAEEKRAAEQGEFQKLAEQRAQERDDALGRLAAQERKTRVAKIAGRLKFRDPEDVIGSLTDEQADDDQLAETALTAIAKAKPYLILGEQERPQIGQVLEPGADPPGTGGPGGDPRPTLTWEDVQKMTPQEVADDWDRVSKVVAAGPPAGSTA